MHSPGSKSMAHGQASSCAHAATFFTYVGTTSQYPYIAWCFPAG
eukprot:gene20231-biopygen6595